MIALRTGLCCLAFAIVGASQAAEGGLQPFQVVRSLETVQDRIATGDQAALPMQRKLLEMADARFRGLVGGDLDNPLNRRALLVYAMSGGNPATVELVLSRMPKDDPARVLGNSIIYYLQGQVALAVQTFAPIEPMAHAPELGAYLALVKGSVLSAEQPQNAIRLLDSARLLAPGTLVEEAALRRSIALSATLHDPKRFIRASGQYVRSYIRSPYASQFADAFVAGVVALHADLELADVSEVTAMMDPEREKVIYLRIARRAAIDGLTGLSAFAAAKAEGAEGGDPRAVLYSTLSSVTSATVEGVLKNLASIDRSRLSEGDRQLLDAAQAVATEMTAKPAPVPEEAPEQEASSAAGTAEATSPQEAPVGQETGPETPIIVNAEPEAPAAPALERIDPAEATMVQARKQLAEIDKLLGETVE